MGVIFFVAMCATLFSLSLGCRKQVSQLPKTDRDGNLLPEYASVRCGSLRFLPQAQCWAVAVSPDGTKVATGSMPGSMNGVIELWDAQTGTQLLKLAENCVNVIDLKWSHDGNVLAASRDGALELFDVTTGQFLSRAKTRPREPSECFHCVTLNRGADLIAAFDPLDQSVNVWRTVDWSPLLKKKLSFSANAVVLFPEGDFLAVGGQGVLEIWELPSGEPLHSIACEGEVVSLAVSPDGNTLAGVVRPSDKSECHASTWERGTGKQIADSEKFAGSWTEVAYSFDGTSVVTGGWTSEIAVRDARSLARLHNIPGMHRLGRQIAVASKSAIVVSADTRIGIWDLKTGALQVPQDSHSQFVSGAVFVNGDARIVTSAPDGMYFWDAATGKRLSVLPESSDGAWGVCVSPDGRYLAAGLRGKDVGLWDAITGAYVATLSGLETCEIATAVLCLQFSSDSRHLIAGGNGIALWDLEAQSEAKVFSTDGMVTHLRLVDEDSSILYSMWGQYELRKLSLREWEDTESTWSTARPVSHGFDVSVHGRYLAMTTRSTRSRPQVNFKGGFEIGDHEIFETEVRLLGTKELVWDFWQPNPYNAYAFSPKGELLATSCVGVIELWSLPLRKLLGSSAGHGQTVTCLAFTSDGSRFVSASSDTTALVWDVSNFDVQGRDD